MTQNCLHETKACIEQALPYVDHIVIVDGGSQDDSIFYFRNWSETEPKLHFYVHPWCDNFSAQRNNYLKHAEELISPDHEYYILVSDPDEWYEERTFKNLKNTIDYMKVTNHNVAGFQCKSISLKGDKVVHENVDKYWKHLLYKYEPGMRYRGNPHEGMVMPSGFRMLNTPLFYHHRKQENVIWKRGMRNSYVGGGGDNVGKKNKLWVDLMGIVKSIFGYTPSWHEYERYLIKGDISPEIKSWMINKARLDDGWSGASEMREHYKYYFRILHPEEEPNELKDAHIK